MRHSGPALATTLLLLGTGLTVQAGAVPAGAVPAPPAPDPVVRLVTDPGTVVRAGEVPVTDGVVRTDGFSMVGLTWDGAGTPEAQVRTRSAAGGWSRWSVLHPLTDGPTATSAEGRGATARGTELRWVGPSTAAQVRTVGSAPDGLALVLVDPGSLSTDDRAVPPSPSYAGRGDRPRRAPRPDLRSRRDWGADNSLRNGRPRYSGRLKQVHVHHTATGNGYSRADVPALIRGMYRYHTQTLGWFDLGYNFLVDRFGRSWVGRSGGAARLVQGAHTLGFNHKSVGIAVIGSHGGRRPERRALRAVVRLAAWKLDKAGRRATGRVGITSSGSDRFAAGRKVRLPVIDGHRDTNQTACPGGRLYRRLDDVRRLTQRRLTRFS